LRGDRQISARGTQPAGSEVRPASCRRNGAIALNGKSTSPECLLHASPDPRHLDWQALIDAADHRVKCRRVEPRKLAILNAKEALALQGPHERGWASPAALDLGIQV